MPLMRIVVAAIAIAPSSAPVSLLNTLIQADAYAVTLLGYTLTGDGSLDFFHAGYALLLAFSSLIPLTAVSSSSSDSSELLQKLALSRTDSSRTSADRSVRTCMSRPAIVAKLAYK